MIDPPKRHSLTQPFQFGNCAAEHTEIAYWHPWCWDCDKAVERCTCQRDQLDNANLLSAVEAKLAQLKKGK